MTKSEYAHLKKVQAARHRQQMLSANAPPELQTHRSSSLADVRSQPKKKKAVKRVVTIPGSGGHSTVGGGRGAPDWRQEHDGSGAEEREAEQKNSDEAIESFQKKVNELREEGGTKWLLIWNEMEHMQAQEAGAKAQAAAAQAQADGIVAPKAKKAKKRVRRKRRKRVASKEPENATSATTVGAAAAAGEERTEEEVERARKAEEEEEGCEEEGEEEAGEEEEEEGREEEERRLVRDDDDATPAISIEDMDRAEKQQRDGERIELTSGMLATTPQRGPLGRLSSSAAARKALASPLRYDADDLPSEEFFVERVVEGEYEARIVVVNEECVREADIEGNWVLQIEGKFVDSITPHSEGSPPLLSTEGEPRAGGRGREYVCVGVRVSG